MKTPIFAIALALILNTLLYTKANSQTQIETEQAIRHYDSLFWQAYNNCNVDEMSKYLSDDFEFYHDKGGLSKGFDSFVKSLRENLCNSNNPRVYRKSIVSTTKIFPLANYGGIIQGEHQFYVGSKDNLDSKALYTHVWHYDGQSWKMTRALSYDHQKVSPELTSVVLTQNELNAFAGEYQAPQTGLVVISTTEGGLRMQAGKMDIEIKPNSPTTFSNKNMPLTFEFEKDTDGKITAMLVKENGQIAERATRK